ncbi:translation factor Sua5 [Thioclava dalianensis]|uniref:Threonylcarbamoyl-AMP synthase n=1 Tax=Thioclava dalianensis TaxID=1185766 RepID=A0A074THW1_9RHOB|nr:L-threonylcarbamoyladenylate synthase [Thioclava dalianensis]KEP71276.1 translation factor Sua5 [Thioclava dalianensis]SFM76137.1 L-threonylcarbamoyladenylate synthase [Thioclava dalianensis]
MSDPTEILPADVGGFAKAARLLAQGALVAIPTETVYGLAGDARSDHAVAAIFAAKGRPQFNPLIVHVADLELAEQIAEVSPAARDLAQAFWPGPLTLVLPLRPDAGISELVSAGHDTVAIRLPAHPVARAILRAFGGPLAAPSANPSGKISPTTARHVLDGLSGKIAAVIDGGACAVGLESTIISLDPPRLLRPGGVPAEALAGALGATLPQGGNAQSPNAPGQLSSHYAPGAGVRLGAAARQPGEIFISFGPGPAGDLSLSPSGDLIEGAANLFSTLRAADALAQAQGLATIAFAPIPDHGLGAAINDRLRRAAAPRS